MIARDGQCSPVLVDSYHRVAALEALLRELVGAVTLAITQPEALVLAWRLERDRKNKKTALGEGGLLAELAGTHDRSSTALAAELHRTRSRVCQRLGRRSWDIEASIVSGWEIDKPHVCTPRLHPA